MSEANILSQEQIQEELKKLPDWQQLGDKIIKEFEFENFLSGVNFIHTLAPTFERLDHHPDIHILYNHIIFELQRFDVGKKITDKDIESAHEIERAAADWKNVSRFVA